MILSERGGTASQSQTPLKTLKELVLSFLPSPGASINRVEGADHIVGISPAHGDKTQQGLTLISVHFKAGSPLSLNPSILEKKNNTKYTRTGQENHGAP